MANSKRDTWDKRTNKRMHEHLENKEDKITEEDIKNAKTSVDEEIGKTKKLPRRKKSVTTEEPKPGDHLKDNTDPDIETTWNILES